MKTCSSCREAKPLSDFHNRTGSRDGLHGKCKACISQEHARYAASRKGLDNQLRNKYGISIEDYERMLEEQEGKCRICRQQETALDCAGRKVKRLAVDHDPATGVVRGLLCQRCNVGLGHLPTAELLAGALAYLLSVETAVSIP